MLVSRRSDRWSQPAAVPEASVEVLRPEGDLDAKMAPEIRRKVTALAPGTRLVVDLGATDFIDSVGVGLLIGISRSVRANGGSVVLADPRSSVAKVLRATGVAEIVPVTETTAEAVQLVAGPAGVPLG